MKRIVIKKLAIILAAFLLLSLVLPFVSFAQELRENETVVLLKDETIDRDYFAAGENVTLSGTVNGDAYLAGGTILIDGTVNGDVLAAGGTISIRGNIAKDVRAVGGTVTISGQVGGNITVGAGTTAITENANVDGSLVAGTGTLELFAPLGKGATFGAGTATIGSEINGDVMAGVGTITLTNSAKIDGDVTYYSEEDSKLIKADTATISGKTTHNVVVEDKAAATKSDGEFAGFAFFLKMLSLLSTLILGLLLLHLVPEFTKRTAENIENNFFLSVFIGFATILLLPIIVILLLLTLVGIPFAIILVFYFTCLLFFAKIFAALFIGKKTMELLKQKTTTGWMFFIGLVIYAFLTAIPFFGWIISLVALFAGTGALFIEKKCLYSSLRGKKLL